MTRDVPESEIMAAMSDGYRMHRDAGGGSDYLVERELPDGRHVYLMPHSFGGLRLNVGPPDKLSFDDEWQFQFEQRRAAWRAALGWDGKDEPEGWYRHPATARRRPGGDPTKEIIQP
jgi:hypothetical protein